MALTLQGGIRSVDACWGDAHASTFPDDVTVRLYRVSPLDGGAELDDATYPGYAPLVVGNDDAAFPPADTDTGIKTTALLTICTATGDWPDGPRYVGLCDDTTLLEVLPLRWQDAAIPITDGLVRVQGVIYDESTLGVAVDEEE